MSKNHYTNALVLGLQMAGSFDLYYVARAATAAALLPGQLGQLD